jgi:formyltetrahydrofolate deformylase
MRLILQKYSSMENTILLIDCPDEKGLIFKITGLLYKNQLNILENSEFVDKNRGWFFMRTEFTGFFPEKPLLEELREVLPTGSTIKLTKKEQKKVVLMVTKEHHCMSDLLVRNYFKDLNMSVEAVISNYMILDKLASKFDIPFYYVSHENRSREDHEKYIHQVLSELDFQYIVLAKYMRILSPDFIAKYPNKIINIHHSFLPAFVGASPYAQAYERGVKIIGATAHFVNEDLDQGPIIAQNVLPVAHSHSATDMALAGKDVEKIVLAKALKLVLEERVFVSGNKTVIFD